MQGVQTHEKEARLVTGRSEEEPGGVQGVSKAATARREGCCLVREVSGGYLGMGLVAMMMATFSVTETITDSCWMETDALW